MRSTRRARSWCPTSWRITRFPCTSRRCPTRACRGAVFQKASCAKIARLLGVPPRARLRRGRGGRDLGQGAASQRRGRRDARAHGGEARGVPQERPRAAAAADAAGAARDGAAPRATRCAAPPPRRTSSFSAAARWYSTGAPSSMCSPATVSVTASRWTRNRSSRCGAVCPKKRSTQTGRAPPDAARRGAAADAEYVDVRGSVRAARRAVGGGNERRVSASKRVVCDESCMFI